jgi:hypothetical protein
VSAGIKPCIEPQQANTLYVECDACVLLALGLESASPLTPSSLHVHMNPVMAMFIMPSPGPAVAVLEFFLLFTVTLVSSHES